jgi:HEAT repeat protein
MDRGGFYQALTSPDLGRRIEALNSCALSDSEDVEAVVRAIGPRQQKLHQAALSAAEQAGYDLAGPIFDSLAVSGASPEIQCSAIKAISAAVEGEPPSSLLQSAHDPNVEVRLTALRKIGGRPGQAAEDILLYYLDNPSVQLEGAQGREDEIRKICVIGLGFPGRKGVVGPLVEVLCTMPSFRGDIEESLRKIQSAEVYKALLDLIMGGDEAPPITSNPDFRLACMRVIAEHPPRKGAYLERYKVFARDLWRSEVVNRERGRLFAEFGRLFDEESAQVAGELIRTHRDNLEVIQRITESLADLEISSTFRCWMTIIHHGSSEVVEHAIKRLTIIAADYPDMFAKLVLEQLSSGPIEPLSRVIRQMREDSRLEFFNRFVSELPDTEIDTPPYQASLAYLDVIWDALAQSHGVDMIEQVVRAYGRSRAGRNVLSRCVSKRLAIQIDGQKILQWLLARYLNLPDRSREKAPLEELISNAVSLASHERLVALQIAQFAVNQGTEAAWQVSCLLLGLVEPEIRHMVITQVLEGSFHLLMLTLLVDEGAVQASDLLSAALATGDDCVGSTERIQLLRFLPKVPDLDPTDILLRHIDIDAKWPPEVIIEACGHLGKCDESRVSGALLELLRYPDPNVVLAALDALGELAVETTIEGIKNLQGISPNEAVKQAAQDILDRIFTRYAEPFPSITDLSQGDFVERLKIIERLADPRAEAGLLEALEKSVVTETTVAIIRALKTSCESPEMVIQALRARRQREFDAMTQAELVLSQSE